MGDSNVENLDDEELLVFYESTKKLLESRINTDGAVNGKVEILQKKLLNIEDELRSRSLWEGEEA